MEPRVILESSPLFDCFTKASLERIAAAATVKELTAREHVVRLGAPVHHLGVVVRGTCAILIEDDHGNRRQVATLCARELFGEMSLLTGEPSAADVVAEAGARLLLVPQALLSVELASNPKAIQFLSRTLTERLRRRQGDSDEERTVERARMDARRARRFDLPADSEAACRILVLNAGSSSLKYDYLDASAPEKRARGLVERIGERGARHRLSDARGERVEDLPVADHEAAIALALRRLCDPEHGLLTALTDLSAVGHRVVHGGERYGQAVVIDDAVLKEIAACVRLAPLHNPANLAGIEAMRRLLPTVPQVAVFDTAFTRSLPDHASTYAIPFALAEKHGLRRYGFHGTSHKYVAQRAAAHLGRAFRELRLITCHLGNGASVCAIDHGRAVDTSMGMTPLEGLIMGTRAGDLDPGLVLHLVGALGMPVADVDRMLNRESGLLGVSGLSKDMRELEQAAADGNARARLAIAMFCQRVKKYIGAYTAVLGGVDALVFTGGIGEGSAWIRARVCQGLAGMGIVVDELTNRAPAGEPHAVRPVSDSSSRVPILVIPTDEEAMIARETMTALGLSAVSEVMRRAEDLPIPINTSAHHVHLAQEHVEVLFGAGHHLTRRSDLLQPGQFACAEAVNLVGPKGAVERVRVLGPVRKQSQVEISRTEEFKLGIDAPIRASGDVGGSPGLTLVGPAGEVRLEEGVICAMRHIHMSPEDALRFAVKDRDIVRVRIPGERSLTFGEVLVRVSPDFRLEMHIDTDEANAAELSQGALGFLDGIQARRT